MARARYAGKHLVHQLLAGNLALGQLAARFPKHQAGAGQLAVHITIEHRAARQNDGGKIHRGRSHQSRGSGLVASRGQHHAVERISGQDLDQPKVGEVAIERGGGPLARLLDGVSGKFKRQSARIAYARLHALGQRYMDPVARDQIAATLRNANNRPAGLQLSAGDAVIAVTFQVDGCFARLIPVKEPDTAAQFFSIVHLIAQTLVDHVLERLSVGKPAILLQEKTHRLVEPILGVICAVG